MNRPKNSSSTPHLLPLSAPNPAALEVETNELHHKLKTNPSIRLEDIAKALQSRHPAGAYRRVIISNDTQETLDMLDNKEGTPRRIFTNKKAVTSHPPVVFMFPGQGSQYVNMGKDLYLNEPVFRENLDLGMKIFEAATGTDLKSILFPCDEQQDQATEQLKQTIITQPALFCIEYALAQLWISKGILPDAMIGHSSGEYTAACLSGVLTLTDALELISHRARFMQDMPHGTMATLHTSSDIATTLIKDTNACIASINSPTICVISGTEAEINVVLQKADQQNVLTQVLRTSHAFHSPMMEPAQRALQEYTQKTTFHPPSTPFMSNLTGNWFTAQEASTPDYWGAHLRNTVHFSAGMSELMKHNSAYVFIEIGPGNTLCTLTRQHMEKPSMIRTTPSLRHPKEDHNDQTFFLTARGKCWLAGINFTQPHQTSSTQNDHIV